MRFGREFACVLVWLFLTGSAHAENVEAERRGEALLKEGLSATKRGDFQHAQLAFLQASVLVPRGVVWRNLGLAEMKLGRPVDALKHYRLAASSSDLDADKRGVLQQNVRDAYAVTGHIEVQANSGAAVVVDGLAVPDATTEPIDVMPGKHVVEASSGTGGTKTARADVDAVANMVVTADVRVVDEQPIASPSASAAIPAPVAAHPFPRHDIAPPMPPPPSWSAGQSVAAALGGVGVVSLGIAAFFFTQVENDKSAARAITTASSPSACTGSAASMPCVPLENAYASQRADADWALVFLGAGSAALVTGAALWFWPESTSSTRAVGPLIVPHGAGVEIRGPL
ncbi:MAG: hypothetical protein M3O46_11115 [Myxococcota bacterium]|nr:hypothetical protein [Myxococcota bacterium]